MPSDTGASGRNKPTTGRTSIRHSLNFASVGKAFADVINKDGRGEVDKNAKKALKDSKRQSLKSPLPPVSGPRTSVGADSSRPSTSSSISRRSSLTPDSKTVTQRKRMSAPFQQSIAEDGILKPAVDILSSKPPTARPRPISSGLPKYRPRSIVGADGLKKQPPSPTRAGVRRRLSTSDDDTTTEGTRSSDKSQSLDKPAEKNGRPISPLPHRAALKSVVNASPPTPSTPKRTKGKVATPTTSNPNPKPSPTRPSKHAKTATASTSIPRPGSASSLTPHTPKTPSTKSVHSRTKGKESPSPSPLRSDSPMRHSKKPAKNVFPLLSPPSNVGNMSQVSEGGSDDGDYEDVALLLAPVAALGAPTPAMPRINLSRSRRLRPPETPTRSALPGPSYVTQLPPDTPSPRLRNSPNSNHTAPRGSILSWDQVADEASRTLGEDEIKTMLAEVESPFRSNASSPASSPRQALLQIPESPCLSALNTPSGGYGSISQVMLPDVTPSPAMHHFRQSSMVNGSPGGDSATVTLLRLQLASVENTAKERLLQLQAMEEEIHILKEARRQEALELSQQVGLLEDQMRGNLEARERSAEEQQGYIFSLERQLEVMNASRVRDLELAVGKARLEAQTVQDDALRIQKVILEKKTLAQGAARDWTSVGELATSEVAMLKGDREMLAVLLSQLDLAEAQLAMN